MFRVLTDKFLCKQDPLFPIRLKIIIDTEIRSPFMIWTLARAFKPKFNFGHRSKMDFELFSNLTKNIIVRYLWDEYEKKLRSHFWSVIFYRLDVRHEIQMLNGLLNRGVYCIIWNFQSPDKVIHSLSIGGKMPKANIKKYFDA